MLPYFKFTEDVQSFCQFMGFTINLPRRPFEYVCAYTLEGRLTPYITTFNLEVTEHPLIPSEKVFEYLTLMLNGYSREKAVEKLGVVRD